MIDHGAAQVAFQSGYGNGTGEATLTFQGNAIAAASKNQLPEKGSFSFVPAAEHAIDASATGSYASLADRKMAALFGAPILPYVRMGFTISPATSVSR